MKNCGICGEAIDGGVICHKECVDKILQIVEQTEELDQMGIPWDKVYGILKAYTEGRLKELPPFLKDDNPGLQVKYRVYKAENGEPVEDCFVLRPDIDPAAREALLAYAEATENEALSVELFTWIQDLDDHTEESSPFDKSGRVCRVCGCTQYNACLGGCYWVEPDLCSACATAAIMKERVSDEQAEVQRV